MEKNHPRKRVCVAWILQLFLIFGYFGVSDTDTDVLLPHGVNVNFPPGSSTSPSTGSASSSRSNGKDVNTSYNKLRMKRESDGSPHDEEMRLWDQIFSNALATSNTSQWMHLRQIFDRVEEELHKTKSTGNTSLNQISKIHPNSLEHQQSTTFVGPKLLLPKTTSSSSKPHPKFSYHRVPGLRGRGRPFAAVSLAIADSSQEKEGHNILSKTGQVTPTADHTFSQDSWSKNDQETFSPDDTADYQLDQHHDDGGAQEHEILLNDDLKHFKNFAQSHHHRSNSLDSSSPAPHLFNKFESFQQKFESFSVPNSGSGTSRPVFEMGVTGQVGNEDYYNEVGSSGRFISTSSYSSSSDPEHKGRHHHHRHHRKGTTNHFHHLRTLESDNVHDRSINHHHHYRRRKRLPQDHHTHNHEYQQDT